MATAFWYVSYRRSGCAKMLHNKFDALLRASGTPLVGAILSRLGMAIPELQRGRVDAPLFSPGRLFAGLQLHGRASVELNAMSDLIRQSEGPSLSGWQCTDAPASGAPAARSDLASHLVVLECLDDAASRRDAVLAHVRRVAASAGCHYGFDAVAEAIGQAARPSRNRARHRPPTAVERMAAEVVPVEEECLQRCPAVSVAAAVAPRAVDPSTATEAVLAAPSCSPEFGHPKAPRAAD